MTTERDVPEDTWPPAASRPEWVLMYVRGLSVRQISVLCRVDYEKVRLHIRSKERQNPAIFGRRLILHDQPEPAPPPAEPRRVPWDARYAELRELIDRTGHLPQQLSDDANERRLYKWMRWQRERNTGGRLTEDQIARMNGLGNWQGTSLGNRDARWRTMHAGILQFIQDEGRMPQRGRDGATPHEATLDIWIQNQRAKARAGKLPSARREILDETVPGWNQTWASSRTTR